MEVVEVENVFRNGDPRLAHLPLMGTPKSTVIIIILYYVFVKVLGPNWMNGRKPFELRWLMIVYNIGVTLLSIWMFMRFASLYLFKYNWRCEPVDFSESEDGLKAVMTCYVYYVSKIIELTDTIVFVLRKKDSQITFLHLLHHGMVPLTSWYGINYGGGGYALIFPMANCFVHIWMYAYYGLAAMGPKIQKYLWWKKYITTLQLIQFVVVVISTGQLAIFPPENCNASNFVLSLILGQSIVFFGLFIHFYSSSYVGTKKSNKVYQNGHTPNIRKEN